MSSPLSVSSISLSPSLDNTGKPFSRWLLFSLVWSWSMLSSKLEWLDICRQGQGHRTVRLMSVLYALIFIQPQQDPNSPYHDQRCSLERRHVGCCLDSPRAFRQTQTLIVKKRAFVLNHYVHSDRWKQLPVHAGRQFGGGGSMSHGSSRRRMSTEKEKEEAGWRVKPGRKSEYVNPQCGGSKFEIWVLTSCRSKWRYLTDFPVRSVLHPSFFELTGRLHKNLQTNLLWVISCYTFAEMTCVTVPHTVPQGL